MSGENGFENQRVVVLGGSSGIGLAVAEQVALQGAEVVIVSSKATRVQEAVKSIGEKAQGQAVDVSDEKAIESFFTNLGAFDHLVFTAGDSLQLDKLADTDLKQARRAFELRYWSALATVKYGSPRIRKGGSIVLTTGIAGQRPQSGWVIAASVCGTIEALTRALAIESVGKRLPVGRVGEAHDIAQAYLFLMKEGFSTGQTVVVDGGTVLV
jgi:NAD(P)-dependent dehydrogenase (short-subunit alcohol dehydrogenase family)